MTEPVRLLMLDWDGTLVDSIGRIVESMHVAATAVGIAQQSDAAVKGIIGLGLPEAIAELYPELLNDSRFEPFKQAYVGHYLALEDEPSAFFPGVFDMLESLRERGMQLAVATGKSRRGLDRVLSNKGLQDYFVTTRCADETASKPHPQMLHEIMAQCGVAPSQALMVGDSVYDLRMARHAGVGAIAAAYGAMPADTLALEKPDALLNQFVDIDVYLKRFLTEKAEHAL
ncbi:HAD-IA family hydrolase [Atopomonas sediminilitoris]|uniref:HAD-IA family hydrolase n=1 Tax=Atopomonas sediminilitoris TaxID=2919919 RepID=UPI001F4DB537|nr:HAD-IA family hydrolase [Atopomonas sediminilitoris]MCJ8167750.1 HAD-IA family hydrolase [Atopomonas sediminilitoris]